MQKKNTHEEHKHVYAERVFPKVSILLLAHIQEPGLQLTLSSILQQDYPDYEVVVALSEDALQADVPHMPQQEDQRVRYFSFGNIKEIPLLSTVFTHLQGVYVQILFPGYVYLSPHALHDVMQLALQHQSPSFIYSACLINEPPYQTSLFRPLSRDMLREINAPTDLACCWIRRDLFEELREFAPISREDYGWELFYRLTTWEKLHSYGIKRVFMENRKSPSQSIRSLWRACRRIRQTFGVKAAIYAAWHQIQKT